MSLHFYLIGIELDSGNDLILGLCFFIYIFVLAMTLTHKAELIIDRKLANFGVIVKRRLIFLFDCRFIIFLRTIFEPASKDILT
jgi:hypothetical protein